MRFPPQVPVRYPSSLKPKLQEGMPCAKQGEPAGCSLCDLGSRLRESNKRFALSLSLLQLFPRSLADLGNKVTNLLQRKRQMAVCDALAAWLNVDCESGKSMDPRSLQIAALEVSLLAASLAPAPHELGAWHGSRICFFRAVSPLSGSFRLGR